MKGKKILAVILSALMLVTSIMPQKVYAEDSEANIIAENVAGNTYTDSTAVAEDGYEYVVTGSDGSIQTIVIPAAETGENATETVYTEPDITWTRTSDDSESVVSNLSFVNTTGAVTANGIIYDQYTALTWDWASLKKLINNTETKQEKVWNYTGNSEISAATFKSYENNWDVANVHKISGTFTWPEGYTLNETTITLESVNDEYYAPIYEYIADNGLSDLFPEGKVFPVNDDVYVVMWVDDGATTVTADNINDYLLFWTGTSGKGIWTQNGNTNADWNRQTPATFLSATKQGIRAFHDAWPNAVGVTDGSNNTDVENMDTSDSIQAYLAQTDYWYTLTDTTAINSVMRNNYPNGIAAGSKVHLDLYCFNNDKTGGIDELKIGLSKQQETETSVQVQYYYGNVTDTSDTTHYLGSSVLTNQAYGTSISLKAGTKASQLSYMKAAAIVKAGQKDVTDGTQVNNPLVVTRGEDNIIYVLYTAEDAKVVYLTADTDTVEYDTYAHTLNEVVVTEQGYDGNAGALGNGKYTLPDGNTLENVYSVVKGTNPGIYPNNFATGDGSTPTYVVKDNSGNEITNSYTFIKMPGTLTITYEPKAVDYTYDFGVTNLYEGTLNNVERLAEVSVSSEEVSVDGADVTYKPAAADTGDSVDLTLTFTGDYQVTKTINFVPATNVLYEEDYITVSEDGDWAPEGTSGTPIVSDNDSTVYGYTEIDEYVMSGTYSNGAAYKAELTLAAGEITTKTEDAATFEFTGSGFDLISECGADTGMLVVRVANADTGTVVKAYLVDTYFTGDIADEDEKAYITGEGILDYQVPVVRNMNLPYGNYEVTVYGYLINTAGAVTSTMAYGINSAVTSVTAEDIVLAALLDCGLDEEIDVADVEVSFMNEDSVLNGGLGNTAAAGTSVATFAANTEGNSTAEATAVTAYVYLDGFRVYKPLEEDAAIYTTDGEDDVKYASVYDFIENSASELEDWIENAFVYVEYDGDTDISAISEYKIQGPQNEVYLTPGSGIAFALEGYEKDDVVQVAMKAIGYMNVEDTESANAIQTATEMYYEVIPEYDEDLSVYYVDVVNNIDATGILALSGLKISSNITPMASSSLSEKLIVALDKTKAADFVPEYLTAIAKASSVKSGRNTTISIESSTEDVKSVVIEVLGPDGSELVDLGKELTATNTKAVARGKAKYYKYSYTFKTRELDAGVYTFNVYAYDAESKPSAPVTVTVEVK